ncbi:MAG TPA: SDR family NAD(P)-dependent oxidoreductase, partial [Chitinophagaceae bacterium]|nr:SDR family NAD(P)-dependent oxidoreductase [Chitinophagaceae bacterium]
MDRLPDKKIVIIGGTTGIGLSAARAFIAEGAKVVVVGRSKDSVEQAGNELGKNGQAICGDATDPNTASSAIELCLQEFRGFDGLYHVAGGSGRKMGDG